MENLNTQAVHLDLSSKAVDEKVIEVANLLLKTTSNPTHTSSFQHSSIFQALIHHISSEVLVYMN